jgi:epoxyqueuosine reductase QueG
MDLMSGGSDGALTEALKQAIANRSDGIAMVGVAPTDRFGSSPPGHGPRDFIPDANAVVVIGYPIADGLTDLASFMEDSELVKDEGTYKDWEGREFTWNPKRALRNHIERRSSHEIINIELQTLSMYAANFLEKNGHKSIYLPTTYGQTFSWRSNIDWSYPHALQGPFSHRHAAVAAGLGEFGLNNLVLTRKYGPRNRFVTVITRAPLAPDPLLEGTICLGETCSQCVRRCHGQAFGEVYELNVGGHENRLAKIDIGACMRGFDACYKGCIAACPIGRL